MRLLLICLLLLPAPLVAQEPPEPKEDICTSCTARHKALQKLQKDRKQQAPETVSKPARDNQTKDQDQGEGS